MYVCSYVSLYFVCLLICVSVSCVFAHLCLFIMCVCSPLSLYYVCLLLTVILADRSLFFCMYLWVRILKCLSLCSMFLLVFYISARNSLSLLIAVSGRL
jgi:hypothetical protein